MPLGACRVAVFAVDDIKETTRNQQADIAST
jgi:hypothetical protein